MLIDRIRSIFGLESKASDPAPGGADPDVDLHLAACTLLLEIAYADGEFSDAERVHLEEVLERHFGLPPEAGHTLLDLAEKERKSATDHFRFTSQLKQRYDLGQKMVLAEVMWGIVLSDGEIADREQYLTRKISNLLGLEPGYLSAAKNAAAAKRG
jgi:uncharacterized tellurite resistance protein B-like protein